MGIYKYIREAWKKPKKSENWKNRLFEWRREPATLRVEHPTRIDRARSLGYKAKQSIIVVRQRMQRSARQLTSLETRKRRTAASGRKKTLQINYKTIAERRVADKYKNMEVLNSYWVGKDGKNVWYEVILVDRDSPHVKKDKDLKWIGKSRGRAYRGVTSAAKKGRGLMTKGKGTVKNRPSKGAAFKRKINTRKK